MKKTDKTADKVASLSPANRSKCSQTPGLRGASFTSATLKLVQFSLLGH